MKRAEVNKIKQIAGDLLALVNDDDIISITAELDITGPDARRLVKVHVFENILSNIAPLGSWEIRTRPVDYYPWEAVYEDGGVRFFAILTDEEKEALEKRQRASG